MQKGLAASPSWPMGTKGYVIYQGKKADFFIGDLGPGTPSERGVMLDLDGKTFADLTGGSWDHPARMVEGNGGLGHIPVDYVITEWGPGPGKKGAPVPFSTGAWKKMDTSTPASTPASASASTPAAVAAESATCAPAAAALGMRPASAAHPMADPALPTVALSVILIACAAGTTTVKAVKTFIRRR